jgi:muramoyltetrapeptide carboxypeptidase LdcA involved in peptidoglycan recycling
MAGQFDLSLDGCVLFWDVGLFGTAGPSDRLRRLAEIVSLERLAGMLVGPDVRQSPDAWAAAVDEALCAVVPHARYPVVANADIGHLDPKWVVPYGRSVRLDSTEESVVFPRPAP